MAGKSSSTGRAKAKASAPRAAKAQKTAASLPPSDEKRNILREVLGVVLIGAGLLLAYFSFAEGASGAAVSGVLRGFAGSLYLLAPLIVIWLGALVTFSNRERRVKPGRLMLMLLLVLIVSAVWHVFSYDEIRTMMTFSSFANFLHYSFLYRKGGGGVMGALLTWPIHRGLMGENAFGSVVVLGTLLVADLILLRKISLRRLGGRVRQSYDDYVQSARQRADQKRLAAEQRAQALVVPTVTVAQGAGPASGAPPARAPRSAKARKRAPLPDSADLETWDIPPAAPPGQAPHREMVIERISPDDPMPGEPRVRPVSVDLPVPDVPGFLNRGRSARSVKPEALRVKEPEPLYRPEPLPPQPDGSEVAEPEPFASRGQAEFAGGDWQEVRLGGEPLRFGDASEPDWRSEPDWQSDPNEQPDPDGQPEPGWQPELSEQLGLEDAPSSGDSSAAAGRARAGTQSQQGEPPFEPTGAARKEKRPVIIAKAGRKPRKCDPAPCPESAAYNYPPIDLLATVQPSSIKNREQVDEIKARKLIDTLSSFGITARLIGIAHGPTVTRFELSPAAGIKVSRITSLADDIALNLAAVSVRIEAPIPGKAAVGVEVPNDTVEVVPLRDVLESNEARKHPPGSRWRWAATTRAATSSATWPGCPMC